LPFNSSIISFHIWLFKESILHCKTMFICWVSLFCNGFTLGPTAQATVVYLWRKVVCLFCLYLWDPPNQDASDHILGLVDKLSRGRRGAWAWVHGVLDLQCKSSWILIDFFLKIKWNCSWNFEGIGMCLWCCWKDLDEQDLMEFIW
jgi:hypothetical protein